MKDICSICPASAHSLLVDTSTVHISSSVEMEWLRSKRRTVDIDTKEGTVRGSIVWDREFQEAVAVFK